MRGMSLGTHKLRARPENAETEAKQGESKISLVTLGNDCTRPPTREVRVTSAGDNPGSPELLVYFL